MLVFRNRSRKEDGFEMELAACCREGLRGGRAQAAVDGDHKHFPLFLALSFQGLLSRMARDYVPLHNYMSEKTFPQKNLGH